MGRASSQKWEDREIRRALGPQAFDAITARDDHFKMLVDKQNALLLQQNAVADRIASMNRSLEDLWAAVQTLQRAERARVQLETRSTWQRFCAWVWS